MIWQIPTSWVRVDRAMFERVLAMRDYKRSGWCGFVVYLDEPTKREFAAIKEAANPDGETYWVHPDMVSQ